MEDSYSNTFHDVCTGKYLDSSDYESSYIYEGQTLYFDGEAYHVISVHSESEYADPYDDHDVSRNYYNHVYLLKAGVLFCNGVYYGAPKLTDVVIPPGITRIDRSAFNFWPDVESITVDKGNKTFDSRDNCNAIIETSSNKLIVGCKNTVIPKSVKSIEDYAFKSCRGLESIVIPKGVVLGSSAFYGCPNLTLLKEVDHRNFLKKVIVFFR